ncbi:hypothetical protein BKA81DRAFT_224448 [Phyllosticta paracitricarpa]
MLRHVGPLLPCGFALLSPFPEQGSSPPPPPLLPPSSLARCHQHLCCATPVCAWHVVCRALPLARSGQGLPEDPATRLNLLSLSLPPFRPTSHDSASFSVHELNNSAPDMVSRALSRNLVSKESLQRAPPSLLMPAVVLLLPPPANPHLQKTGQPACCVVAQNTSSSSIPRGNAVPHVCFLAPVYMSLCDSVCLDLVPFDAPRLTLSALLLPAEPELHSRRLFFQNTRLRPSCHGHGLFCR